MDDIENTRHWRQLRPQGQNTC